MSLALQLFGAPRVTVAGAEVRFDTRKATALLTVLAVTSTRWSRDALVGMLWPDLDRDRARAALRRTLSVTAATVGGALLVARDAVGLDEHAVQSDVAEFRRLAAAEDEASWRAAADLAAEPFLHGFALRDSPVFDEWQSATDDALRTAASQNLAGLTTAAVAAAEWHVAVGWARRRLAVEPLSEPAHADLIRVLAWSGDRPGALAAYRALVRRLDRELGVAPLPETSALYAAVRAGTVPPPRPVRVRRDDGARTLPGSRSPVGRGAVLERMRVPARGAEGRVVALVGGIGMGKTAIIDEVVARFAERGAPVLRLAGHAAEQTLVYAAAHELLRAVLRVDPGLGARLGPMADRLATFAPAGPLAAGPLAAGPTGPAGRPGRPGPLRGAGTALRGPGDLAALHEAMHTALAVVARAGAVLVIDDAHLVDAPSAALLAYATRRVPAGLLVVASWPPPAAESPLPRAVAAAGEVVDLAPLGLDGVSAMLAGTDLDPHEALARTRGIPLLVAEYSGAGSADTAAPGDFEGVRRLVGVRFAAAAPTTQQVVAAAAVVGSVADPELLRAAAGRDEDETVDAIEDAIDRGLLVERADRRGYDVPHELVREVALARLSLARAGLLHGRIADVLSRRHAADPSAVAAGAVARHLDGAGRDSEASPWHLAAARESSRLFAHVEALAHLDAAELQGADPAVVHELRGDSLIRLGRYTDALDALERAAAAADPGRLVAIEHALAGVHDRRGEVGLAIAHLDAALDLVPDGRPGRAALLGDLSLLHHRSGDATAARETAQAAARLATATGEVAALVQAENVLGVLDGARGDHAGARAVLTAAGRRARGIGDVDLVIATSNNLSRVLAAAGDADGALSAAHDAVAAAERQGDRHRLAALLSHLADLLHAAGRDAEAITALTASATAFGEVQEAASIPAIWTLVEW